MFIGRIGCKRIIAIALLAVLTVPDLAEARDRVESRLTIRLKIIDTQQITVAGRHSNISVQSKTMDPNGCNFRATHFAYREDQVLTRQVMLEAM